MTFTKSMLFIFGSSKFNPELNFKTFTKKKKIQSDPKCV